MQTRDPHTSATMRRLLAGACALLVAFGAFLWLKLRLVTDVPRTAYAEPEEKDGGSDASGTAAGADAPAASPHVNATGR